MGSLKNFRNIDRIDNDHFGPDTRGWSPRDLLAVTTPLAPQLVIAVGIVGVIWGSLDDGLQYFPHDPFRGVIRWAAVYLAAITATIMTLYGIHVALFKHRLGQQVSPKAALTAYSTYALAGIVGGIVAYLVATTIFQDPAITDRKTYLLVSIPLSVIVMAFLINQSIFFVGRIQTQAKELERSKYLVIEEEQRIRREVAEFLHGHIQTRLLLLCQKLEDCRDILLKDAYKADVVLKAVLDELDEVREKDVRQASHRLHPAMIKLGLQPAVRALARNFEGGLDLTIIPSHAFLELDEMSNIPEEVSLAAYKLIEESLNNVVKHARASHVDIRLDVSNDSQLTVAVSDDGRGFNTDAATPGLGLGVISASMVIVGGNWDIKSIVGQGTTLRASIPLNPKNTEEPVKMARR